MTHRILVADDSATIRDVVRGAFADSNVEVLTVASGELALDLAERTTPDAIVLCATLGDSDGYAVARRLRASDATRRTPLILLCGAFQPFDAESAGDVVFAAQMQKPFETSALVETIASVLDIEIGSTSAPVAVEDVAARREDEREAPLDLGQELAEHTEPIAARSIDAESAAAGTIDASAPPELVHDAREMIERGETNGSSDADALWASIGRVPLPGEADFGRDDFGWDPSLGLNQGPVRLERKQFEALRRQLKDEIRRELRDEVRATFWELAPEFLAESTDLTDDPDDPDDVEVNPESSAEGGLQSRGSDPAERSAGGCVEDDPLGLSDNERESP